MRRADRLFLIIQYLRSRRLTTAGWLAEKLEVSRRTIYRDVADLVGAGVPVEGEAGMGYALRRSMDLPPLHFTRDELLALDVGLRFAQAYTSLPLSKAGAQAMAKIRSTLDAAGIDKVDRHRLYVPLKAGSRQASLDSVLAAMHQERKLDIDYRNENNRASRRVIWPLGIFFWGQNWTCLAWCESRQDFRNFRLDRIAKLAPLAEGFPRQEGRRLQDYFLEMSRKYNVPLSEIDQERS